MKIKGQLRIKTYKAGTKKLLRKTKWIKNLVVLNDTRGGNLVIRRLGGDTVHDLVITQAKIGTGTNPPVNTNTDLEIPIVSNIDVARAVISIDEVSFRFFISNAVLPNGIYNEFGIFCINQLFARTLIQPAYTKGAGEDTNIEYKIKVFNT